MELDETFNIAPNENVTTERIAQNLFVRPLYHSRKYTHIHAYTYIFTLIHACVLTGCKCKIAFRTKGTSDKRYTHTGNI